MNRQSVEPSCDTMCCELHTSATFGSKLAAYVCYVCMCIVWKNLGICTADKNSLRSHKHSSSVEFTNSLFIQRKDSAAFSNAIAVPMGKLCSVPQVKSSRKSKAQL